MFAELLNCTVVIIWRNQIEVIEAGSFNGLSNLEILDLSLPSNQLTALTVGMFQGLEAISSIVLVNNKISCIEDGVFVNLTKLEILLLARNRPEALTPGLFSGLHSLNTLWLGLNRLTMLQADVFSHLPRPLELSLHDVSEYSEGSGLPDNPLHCDADLCWLKQEELKGTIGLETEALESLNLCVEMMWTGKPGAALKQVMFYSSYCCLI